MTVRVPLDFYRILCVDSRVDADRIEQAHGDRSRQRLRGEFTDSSRQARQRLLDQSREALLSPGQRREHDQALLVPQAEPALGPTLPGIVIDEADLIGALLLLQELGEYEAVLETAALLPPLESPESPEADDRALVQSLALMQLAGEAWQRQQYDRAARSLEQADQLCRDRERLRSLVGELRQQEERLAPFRILELVALPLGQSREREQGLSLLRQLLEANGGLDGRSAEAVGMTLKEFLLFLQQVRGKLTLAEQRQLFEVEARRPSVAARFLLCYCLIAQGFAQQQPTQIHRALVLLQGLPQDTSIEQMLCRLLLGQTDEALQLLEQCSDPAVATFIRENSPGDPSLLSGLCAYASLRLQQEVFAHVRDLRQESTELDRYFANPAVQAYLDALPELPPEEPDSGAFSTTAAPPPPEARTPVVATPISPAPQPERPRRRARRADKKERRPARPLPTLPLAIAAGVIGAGAIALALLQFNRPAAQTPAPVASTPQPTATPVQPPKPTPTPVPASDGSLDRAIATRQVEAWLAAKAEAMGRQHRIAALEPVLADPMLSLWRGRAEAARQANEYRLYEHQVSILDVKPQGPDRGEAIARIRAVEKIYAQGSDKLLSQTDDPALNITYRLVKQGNSWRIADSQVN